MKSQRQAKLPKPKEMLKVGTTRHFYYQGSAHEVKITHICPYCRKGAVVKLPDVILAQQPDATTHVCLPTEGGCNQGFSLDEVL